MFRRVLPLTLLGFLFSILPAYPLTVEEILTLKKAGVTEKTIQMLLQREHEDVSAAERLGIWTTRDGRVIRSTPPSSCDSHHAHYPISVSPFIHLTLP